MLRRKATLPAQMRSRRIRRMQSLRPSFGL
jgi:hypothetical protein